MNPDTTSTTKYLPALKTTSVSFFWKLLIVIAGVAAYYGLTAMENTKSRYDQAKSALPIVIVDALQGKDAIELTSDDLKAMFTNHAVRAQSNKNKQPQPPAEKPDAFIANMQAYVDRAKYQSFVNGNAVVIRLNEEILKDQSSDERAFQQQSDLLAKQYAARKYALETQQNEECGQVIKSEQPAAQNFAHTRRRRSQPKSSAVNCAEIASQIERSKINYELQDKGIKAELAKLNQQTEERVKSVYEDLRPQLLARLSNQPTRETVSSFAFLFPSSVLDQNNGSHVIYKIFWLTCMVILVFGVLFIILLLLRPLPPFAGGAEALTEQAKSFLSKRGAAATPELARTVIVTTAALGVGTAVAVAGGMNMGSAREASFHQNVEDPRAYYQLAENNDRRWPKPEFGPSPQIIVTAIAPVTNPAPTTVHIHSSDPRVDALVSKVEGVNTSLFSMGNGVTSLDNKVSQINNGFIGDLSRINQAVEQLETRHTTLSNQVITAETNLAELKGQADVLSGDVLLRLGITGEAMDGLRRDFVTQLRPPNRNFFSRVRGVFGSSNARYMVTNQSYMALESALCAVGYTAKPATRDLDVALSDRLREDCDLTSPCARSSTCTNPTMQQILPSLKGLVGRPPMTEIELMNALPANMDSAEFKRWKPIILRYTRTSY